MGKSKFVVGSKTGNSKYTKVFTLDVAKTAQTFHKGFKAYKETPLVSLKSLADYLGLANIYVKDESYRFGLNAFKVLGGSFGIASCLAEILNKDVKELSVDYLNSDEIKNQLGPITFITATDGNHGRGIGWTASQLGHQAKVYMPKGTVKRRVEYIKNLGAEVNVTDLNFDDTARVAFELARKNKWILTQDTTFDGYVDFPKWCMQGYTTMVYEIVLALESRDERPTHLFIQAGAGSLAGAVVAFLKNYYGDRCPKIVVVEAENCACYMESVMADDGCAHSVKGNLETIMAGLSVGETCSIGWDILNAHADVFATCANHVAAKGMRMLGAPKGNDRRVISGESGAVGFGYLMELLTNYESNDIKEILEFNTESVVLCISTEGDTDPENYERIVWDGVWTSL